MPRIMITLVLQWRSRARGAPAAGSGYGAHLSQTSSKPWCYALYDSAWLKDTCTVEDSAVGGPLTWHAAVTCCLLCRCWQVWRSTTQLGCGVASFGGRPLYVCNYLPAGNVQGRFKENVPPPGSSWAPPWCRAGSLWECPTHCWAICTSF